MAYEVQIENRTATIDIISRDGNIIKFAIDGKPVEVDITRVENGVYSVVSEGLSYNVELIEDESDNKLYTVNTFFKNYDVEIIDAESKYLKSRKKGHTDEGETVIASPMPGKVVKILVKVGDEVKKNDTVVIVEAMKMQSEYKVSKDRIIKEICVKEGDTVTSKQPLIIVE